MALSLKLSPRSTLKFKTQTKIPARLLAGTGIGIVYANGSYTILADLSDVDPTTFGISAYWQGILDETSQVPALTGLGFSSYIQSLINDTDSAAARATLEISAPLNIRLAKTAAYTSANPDKSKTIALGGSSFYTLTFDIATSYDADFVVRVLNEDTGRAKLISLAGTTHFLFPGQTATVFNQNNTWRIDKLNRWKPTANTTFHISASAGNDSNDGLAAGAGGAFLTRQAARNFVQNHIDVSNGIVITFQCANGTYTDTLGIYGPLVGQILPDQEVWQGDTATPSNVALALNTAGYAFAAGGHGGMGGAIVIKGFRISNGTGGCIAVLGPSAVIQIGTGIELGTTAQNQIVAEEGANVLAVANYAVIGGAATHWLATAASVINCNNITITFSNSPNFSVAFANAQDAIIYASGMTFTNGGTVTGARASIKPPGAIVTGGSDTYLPGNSAMVIERGGYHRGPTTHYQTPGSTIDNVAVRYDGSAGGQQNSALLIADTTGALSRSGNGGIPVQGTNTNDSAAAGDIGEYVSSAVESGSATSISSTTATNLTSISLTAGDWDVSAIHNFAPAGTTSVAYIQSSLSTTSATRDLTSNRIVTMGFASGTVPQAQCALSFTSRFSLSATTTIYLVGFTQFGVSTMTQYGHLSARRVR